MSQIAREAGLSRESLYKALSQTGNPSFETVRSVLQARGLQLSVKRADKPAARNAGHHRRGSRSPPPRRRREAGRLGEAAGEVALRGEAAGERDPGEARPSLRQQILGRAIRRSVT